MALWSIARVALWATVVCSLSAQAQDVFTPAGGQPGLYGQPYGHLSFGTTRSWENYRKGDDTHVPRYPSTQAVNLGDGRTVRYDDVNYGCSPSGCIYFGPGLFVGSRVARTSPPEAPVFLAEVLRGAVSEEFDLRVGFAEHLAADGGASLAQFIQNVGGDEGSADLYMRLWGVDGISLRWVVSNQGSTWTFHSPRATLVAAGSAHYENSRRNYQGDLAVTGATPDASVWTTAIPSTRRLTLAWSIEQQGAQASLRLVLGDAVNVVWVFDDQASRVGLTNPANSDGVGFQGGGLDLNRLVPVLFISVFRAVDSFNQEPLPTATVSLGLDRDALRLAFLQAPEAGIVNEPLGPFVVHVVQRDGGLVPGEGPLALMLEAEDGGVAPGRLTQYTPTALVGGAARFDDLRIDAPGLYVVAANSPDFGLARSPVLRIDPAPTPDSGVLPPDGGTGSADSGPQMGEPAPRREMWVGCDCSSGQGGVLLAAVGVLLAMRRRRP